MESENRGKVNRENRENWKIGLFLNKMLMKYTRVPVRTCSSRLDFSLDFSLVFVLDLVLDFTFRFSF